MKELITVKTTKKIYNAEIYVEETQPDRNEVVIRIPFTYNESAKFVLDNILSNGMSVRKSQL